MKHMKKKVRKFYQRQNEIIDSFKMVDEIIDGPLSAQMFGTHPTNGNGNGNTNGSAEPDENTPLNPSTPPQDGGESQSKKNEKVVKRAVNINFVINIFLFIGKGVAALASGSLSLFASFVDSGLDLLSTLIIFTTSKIMDQRDWKSIYKYPIGKKRLEPIGVIVFSVVMIVSFMQVLVESGKRLLNGLQGDIPPDSEELSIDAIAIMLVTIVVKFFVWIWCRRIKNTSVAALAQDANNDVVFNIVSLIFPLIGGKLDVWWLDPLGGLLLSIYIITEWWKTCKNSISMLAGRTLPAAEKQYLTYMAYRFSPLIDRVKKVTAYYSGERLHVEVDVILDKNTPLSTSHDIGESLQFAYSQLDAVERCWVHMDYADNV